jgi:hypothetical protein
MSDLQRDLKISKEDAAAIVGNLAHESGGFTQMQERNPRGGGRGGLGYGQWTGKRRVQFEALLHGRSPADYQANLEMLEKDLRGNYGLAGMTGQQTLAAMRAAQGVEAKTQVFEKGFEGAGIVSMGSRISRAKGAMQLGGSGSAPSPSPAPASPSDADRPAPGASPMSAKGVWPPGVPTPDKWDDIAARERKEKLALHKDEQQKAGKETDADRFAKKFMKDIGPRAGGTAADGTVQAPLPPKRPGDLGTVQAPIPPSRPADLDKATPPGQGGGSQPATPPALQRATPSECHCPPGGGGATSPMGMMGSPAEALFKQLMGVLGPKSNDPNNFFGANKQVQYSIRNAPGANIYMTAAGMGSATS